MRVTTQSARFRCPTIRQSRYIIGVGVGVSTIQLVQLLIILSSVITVDLLKFGTFQSRGHAPPDKLKLRITAGEHPQICSPEPGAQSGKAWDGS